jgi:hypothetical protein
MGNITAKVVKNVQGWCAGSGLADGLLTVNVMIWQLGADGQGKDGKSGMVEL